MLPKPCPLAADLGGMASTRTSLPYSSSMPLGGLAHATLKPLESNLRAAFAVRAEEWLRDMQTIVDAEVSRLRAELAEQTNQRSQEINREWVKLLSERETLEQEAAALLIREEALDRERAALQGKSEHTDVLVLNIGGQALCAVKRSTLANSITENTALGSMFSGRWDTSLERDAAGHVFVDFSPDLFMPLVEFLRQKVIEDPSNPVSPPEIDPQRLPYFKRMLAYYGLADAVWPKLVGKWEVAWGQVNIEEDAKALSVTAQRDPYQAAAFAELRLKPLEQPVWRLVVSKTRADAPWYYDSVAFGMLCSDLDGIANASFAPAASDLLINLRGGGIMLEDSRSIDSTDLGGMLPAERDAINVEVTFRAGKMRITFDGRSQMPMALRSGPVPDMERITSCCLLVAVTYPWIRVELLP